MGIKVTGGFIVGGQQELSTKPEILEQEKKPKKMSDFIKQKLSAEASARSPRTIESISEPSVVVNGKVKKISKQSAYLLDMMTLDDQ